MPPTRGRDNTTRRAANRPRPGTLPAGTVVLGAVNLAVIAGATAAHLAGLVGLTAIAGGTVATAGATAAVRQRRVPGRWRTINGRRVRLDDPRQPRRARRSYAGGARSEGLPPRPPGGSPVRRGLRAAGEWLGLVEPRANPRPGAAARPGATRGGTSGTNGPDAAPPVRRGSGRAGRTARAVRAGAGRVWRWYRPPTPQARPAPEPQQRPSARPRPADGREGDPQRPQPRPQPSHPAARDEPERAGAPNDQSDHQEVDMDRTNNSDTGDRPVNRHDGGRPAGRHDGAPDLTIRGAPGVSRPMLQALEAADQMVALLTRWEPEGMLEVLHAYRHWPDVLHRLGEAWAILHRKATDGLHGYPLKPAVVELIEAVQRHQQMTAHAAEEIAPTAHALHREQIEALEDPRNAMWDHRANRDRSVA